MDRRTRYSPPRRKTCRHQPKGIRHKTFPEDRGLHGGLQNPVTGNAISGGIIGPMAGAVTGATIGGVDYTGRDFAYGFARPVARENFALAALTAVQPSKAVSRDNALGHASAAVLSALAKTDRFSLAQAVASASFLPPLSAMKLHHRPGVLRDKPRPAVHERPPAIKEV